MYAYTLSCRPLSSLWPFDHGRWGPLYVCITTNECQKSIKKADKCTHRLRKFRVTKGLYCWTYRRGVPLLARVRCRGAQPTQLSPSGGHSKFPAFVVMDGNNQFFAAPDWGITILLRWSLQRSCPKQPRVVNYYAYDMCEPFNISF